MLGGKAWILKGEQLQEVRRTRLDLEERIERWLESDASIVSEDLLVIGRQVRTDFGGAIDLLCIDSEGDLTVIELKRGMTPREATAQVLEYAAWAQELTAGKIIEIANGYLGDGGSLSDAFVDKFGRNLPDNLNTAEVSMLLVAADIDERSERVIRYLSDVYGMRINAVTFNYFSSTDGRELLARLFVLEPEQVEYKSQAKGSSKKTPPPTIEELCERADRKGVGEQFRVILEAAQRHNLPARRYAHSLMFGPEANRNRRLFTVSVGSTATEEATIRIFHETWQEFYPVREEEVRATFGQIAEPIELTPEETQRFVSRLDSLFKSISEVSMNNEA